MYNGSIIIILNRWLVHVNDGIQEDISSKSTCGVASMWFNGAHVYSLTPRCLRMRLYIYIDLVVLSDCVVGLCRRSYLSSSLHPASCRHCGCQAKCPLFS